MYLKRLEIQGFKSLADKIDLQFNSGISAVVGPNGSGKSNIADAVRWVLGEQSVKSLRGSKMEDVIFAGSDKRKPVGMAEVSLTLDNSTSMFSLDYSEITVTRRVYRSAESEYLINKSPCRLRDIHELFMDTGIGREGYSIIGQGKIDEILNSKAEDRRVIIEEAAGIVKYKSRKMQAVKKLNDTEQNLVRINDIISELESQVGPLEEQSQRAREYIGYKDELTDLEVNLLVNQVEDQKGKLFEIIDKEDELKRCLIESETLFRNLESEVEEQKLQNNKIDEQIADVQKDVYETGTLIEKKEAEIMVAGERLKGLDTQKESLLNEISELNAKAVVERTKHIGDEESLSSLKEKIYAEQTKLAEFEGQLSVVDNGFLEDQKTVEENKSDLIDLLNEIAGSKNSISSTEIEVKNYLRRVRQLEEQDHGLTDELFVSQEKEKGYEGLNSNLTQEISTIKQKEERIVQKRAGLGQHLEKQRAEFARTREYLQNKVSRLKALNDLQNDYEGYYRGVKEVLVAGKKGSDCPGVCGVVAEIIRVPKKYETAVEVALGGSLQHIITETDEDARKAIEFLKKVKAGRATFLPLNTIKSSGREKNQKLVGYEGFLGFAADIVQSEHRFSQIVEYLLGRVIIVENIRNATQLARVTGNGIKIVTLEGDIVNPGGSMTGGSSQKGSSRLLGRVREIEDTSAEVAKLKDEIVILEKNIAKTLCEYDSQGEQIKEINARLQELYISVSSLQKDIDVVRQEKQRIDNIKRMILDETKILKDEIETAEDKIKNYRCGLTELQLKDNEIRRKIEKIQGKLSGQEEERARLAVVVTEIKVGMAGLKQEEVNFTQIMTRVMETIKELEIQVEKKEGQIADFEGQKKSLVSDIGEYEKIIRELSQQKGLKEELLNELKNNKQAVINDIGQKEGRTKSLLKEMNDVKEQIHASDVRKARLEIEIDNSTAKLTEEFLITYEEALLKKTQIKNKREVTVRIRELKDAIADLGNVNIGAIEEFERVKERYDFLSGQYCDLEQAKEALFKVVEEMDQIMVKRFSGAFTEINAHFGEVFARLFGGGKAELILTDSDNVLESGIDIFAQPPGKKNQHLSLLSGGERALTAISLLFAILKTKPSPFCVLDEIEASLDEANVDRFAEYLKEFAINTQFVVITHRKGTMEAADVLYGVTMDESSVTKLVSMKMSDKISKVS